MKPIINEARTIDQLIAVDRPSALTKSPYLYLVSIEKSARRIRRVRGPRDIQREASRYNVTSIGQMAARLREVFPDFDGAGIPLKSMWPFITMKKRLENNYQDKLSRRNLAVARKLAATHMQAAES